MQLTKHMQFDWYNPESQDTNVSLGSDLCVWQDQSLQQVDL